MLIPSLKSKVGWKSTNWIDETTSLPNRTTIGQPEVYPILPS